jgi:transmembrane sensor
MLEPGDRLDFDSPTLAVKSAARLDRDEAWMTGHVIFDSTPVSSAIAEMNRYAPRRLKLADPALANRRITGTFSVNDSIAFVRAVAQTFSLTVSDGPDAIVLGGPPDRDKGVGSTAK